MARDLPDWGALSSQATVYEVTDLGELAARLGSIVTYDRRGDVIWLDGFESGLNKWIHSAAGPGGVMELSNTFARNGLFSAHMELGGNGADTASMTHRLPFVVLTPLGYEFSVMVNAPFGDLRINATVYEADRVTEYAILYRAVENDLSYLPALGAFIVFAEDVALIPQTTLFHSMKLVVDSENSQYSRFLLNDQVYLLTEIPGRITISSQIARMDFNIVLTDNGGQPVDYYVDGVIITQNEPV